MPAPSFMGESKQRNQSLKKSAIGGLKLLCPLVNKIENIHSKSIKIYQQTKVKL